MIYVYLPRENADADAAAVAALGRFENLRLARDDTLNYFFPSFFFYFFAPRKTRIKHNISEELYCLQSRFLIPISALRSWMKITPSTSTIFSNKKQFVKYNLEKFWNYYFFKVFS